MTVVDYLCKYVMHLLFAFIELFVCMICFDKQYFTLMCAHINIYICIYIYIYIYICMLLYTYTYTCTYIYSVCECRSIHIIVFISLQPCIFWWGNLVVIVKLWMFTIWYCHSWEHCRSKGRLISILYIHSFINVCIQSYVCTYIRTHAHIYMWSYIHKLMYIYIYIYIYVCIHIYTSK